MMTIRKAMLQGLKRNLGHVILDHIISNLFLERNSSLARISEQ